MGAGGARDRRPCLSLGRRVPGWVRQHQRDLGDAGPHNLGQTSAVGIYPQGASPEGVLDLSGNVWEWCLNEYDNPERVGSEGSEPRVVRGGSWHSYRDYARAAYRFNSATRTSATSTAGSGWCVRPPFADH